MRADYVQSLGASTNIGSDGGNQIVITGVDISN
jgi:hypothetical protein